MMALVLTPIHGYFVALVFLQIRGLHSGRFTVSSSRSYQLVTVGSQVELSCQISPPQSANHMDVGWFRDHFTQMIHTNKDWSEMPGKSIQNSTDHTEILRDDLGTGKITLRIHNTTVFDGGHYYCFFKDGDTHEQARTDLRVTAVGLEMQINIQVQDPNGIMVECDSGGWFPPPIIELRDSMGHIIAPEAKLFSEDRAGLFHTKMRVLLKNSTQGRVIFSLRNLLTGQEKRTSIFLSDILFKSEFMSMTSNKIQCPLIYLIIVHALLIFQLTHSSSWIDSGTHWNALKNMCFEGLPFLLLTGIFPLYRRFKNEVSDSDSLYPLTSSWMNDICWILNTLMVFFTALVLILLYFLICLLSNDTHWTSRLNQRANEDLEEEAVL